MGDIKITKWQMAFQKQDIVELPEKDWFNEHGGTNAYKYASIPTYTSKDWKDASLDGDGNVYFNHKSRLTYNGHPNGPFKFVDFTYLRTTVYLPVNAKVDSFKVTIDKVDDGARVYLYNNNYRDGYHDESKDVKLNGKVVVDFTDQVLKGRQNTIVIVQFDDCPDWNTLSGGIKIEVNGIEEKPDLNLEVPKKDDIDWKFYWAENIKVNPENTKQATGEVNGTKFTYTSEFPDKPEHQVEISGSIYNYENTFGELYVDEFGKPVDYEPKIPNNRMIIKNTQVSKNKLTFDKEVNDPIVVFASIGRKGVPVPVKFDHEIAVLWHKNVKVSGRTITGTEGYAIIKIPGKHKEIKFEYLKQESYANFLFGYAE